MKILVIGGTGTVGSHVVPGLAAGGHAVRVLTRSSTKAQAAPAGIEARVGDLTDPMGLGMAFDGVEGVFLLNALSPTEAQEGLAAIEWCKRAGVRKVVYLSVQAADEALHIPHFGSKVVIEMALARSGIDHTILRPNNFFQNDNRSGGALIGYGLYPQPIGDKGLSRVDVRDVADAAVASFTDPAASNQTFVVAGAMRLTSGMVASFYAQALGSGVVAMDDLDEWEEQCRQQMLPDWLVFDLRMMYEYFQTRGLAALPAEIERTEKLIGHPMRKFTAYVTEAVRAWQQAGIRPKQPKRHMC